MAILNHGVFTKEFLRCFWRLMKLFLILVAMPWELLQRDHSYITYTHAHFRFWTFFPAKIAIFWPPHPPPTYKCLHNKWTVPNCLCLLSLHVLIEVLKFSYLQFQSLLIAPKLDNRIRSMYFIHFNSFSFNYFQIFHIYKNLSSVNQKVFLSLILLFVWFVCTNWYVLRTLQPNCLQ
jgi:hypothetical protein